MQWKNTDDLRQEIAQTENLNQFLKSNQSNFLNDDLPGALARLLVQKNLTKAQVAKQAYISEVYLHQIFSGRRKPSRDRLICICIGMEATLEELQMLLHQCGYSQLYAHSRRDAIIMHGLMHKLPLPEIKDTLFQEETETLF